MMITKFIRISAFLFGLLGAGTVFATPFSNTVDCDDAGLCAKMTEGNVYSFQHDLTGLGIPGSALATDASIGITFKDDDSASDDFGHIFIYGWDYREEVSVSFDSGAETWDVGGGGDIIPDLNTSEHLFDFSLDISAINDDGILNVALTIDNDYDWGLFGCDCVADIYFVKSELSGNYEDWKYWLGHISGY